MKSRKRIQPPVFKRIIIALSASAGIFFLAVLQPFVHLNYGNQHPGSEKVSIEELLEKTELKEKDYKTLYQQTGLGRVAVDRLREEPGYKKEEILAFQEAFFKERQTECRKSSFFTKQDRISEYESDTIPLAPLEDGDIFLTFSSHTLGWKHGHAGLLIDAEKKQCLEATMPGSRSCIKNARHWKTYSSFVILRLLDTDGETREKIASYAKENLTGIPYSLTSGFVKDTKEHPITAQCAYLIWYAYDQFGYNLDSDGGKIVTVRDLMESSRLEIVQSFGEMAEFEQN